MSCWIVGARFWALDYGWRISISDFDVVKFLRMPFKTRRQKASAAEKKISFSALGSVTYRGPSLEKVSGAVVDKLRMGELTGEVNGQEVKSELAKIVLLAGLIIGLQVALKVLHLRFLG